MPFGRGWSVTGSQEGRPACHCINGIRAILLVPRTSKIAFSPEGSLLPVANVQQLVVSALERCASIVLVSVGIPILALLNFAIGVEKVMAFRTAADADR